MLLVQLSGDVEDIAVDVALALVEGLKILRRVGGRTRAV